MKRTPTALLPALLLLAATAWPAWARPVEKPAFPDGWRPASPRAEIQPAISFDPNGGPDGAGVFVLTTDGGIGRHGVPVPRATQDRARGLPAPEHAGPHRLAG